MTVAELIAKLEKCPPNYPVISNIRDLGADVSDIEFDEFDDENDKPVKCVALI